MTPKEKNIDEEVLNRIAKAVRDASFSLDLRNTKITNETLGAIAGRLNVLTSLQNLDITDCYRVTDLTPLSTLTSLRSLNLTGCDRIADLSPLSTLSSLQKLDLTYCDQIADLSTLSTLTSLESLDLGLCRQITDLTPLSTLESLQNLGLGFCVQIVDLTPLSSLTRLKNLDLRSSCDRIADLTPLSSLTSLESLNLEGPNRIPALAPLSGLSSLKELNLNFCVGVAVFSPALPRLPALKTLYLYGSSFRGLPLQVCGDGPKENVLKKLRAHYKDLEQGAAQDAEVKVLLLGNGGVGKTQLSRGLRRLPYDEQVPSTHGIQLESTTILLDSDQPPVRLNIWDFGGQEIYHGTHSLFVRGCSVYFLVWTPELEGAAPYFENNILMRHRSLRYWLDYLRAFAGTGSPVKVEVPVIVIQSKCDTPEDCMGQPPTGSTEDFSFLDKGQVSAKQGRYLDEVMAALKKAVRQALRLRGPIAIGIGRARVRDRLREMVRENPERNRLVDRADFDRICDQGRDISDKGALLDYLHYTGAVGVVAGQIVLDQSWALHAIYSLFERKRVLPLLQALGGRFTRANLEDLAWSQYSRTEQEVFLRMMADCGICFRVRALRDQEWEYIAPELLPGWPEAERKILIPAQVSEPRAQAEARFSFLHEGILRDYLSRIGKHAGNAANYWRYGFAFREETTGSMVLMQSAWENQETQSGPGSLKFEAWGGDAAELVEILLADLQRLPIGEQPVIHWKRRTEEQLSPTSVADASRERSEDLLSLSIAPIGSEASGDPEVYISYAWGDETAAGKIRGEIADGVEECAQAEGWTVRRDMNEIAPGASISEFMSRIQHGGLIIAILSRRYLERPRCMAELYGVFVDGRSNRKEFRKRIVPVVLDDAHIGTIDGRAEVARYWEAQYKKVERNLRRLGREDLLEYLSMKEWYLKVGGLLHYISDIKCPWGNDAIRANNYATLRAMLSSRRAGSR